MAVAPLDADPASAFRRAELQDEIASSLQFAGVPAVLVRLKAAVEAMPGTEAVAVYGILCAATMPTMSLRYTGFPSRATSTAPAPKRSTLPRHPHSSQP